MTVLAEGHDTYHAAFEQVRQQVDRGRGAALDELRTRAFARFAEHGFPTTTLESWRFTNVGPIARGRFERPSAEDHETPEALTPYKLPELGGPQVVCVNGRFSSRLSRLGPPRDRVEIRGLAEVLATDPEVVTPYLGRLAGFEAPEASFTALNTALLEDGVLVRVPDHVVVDAPIHLLFATTGTAGTMAHPRVLVVAGEHSQASLVESHVGLGEGASLTNPVTEMVIGDHAVVDHYKLIRERAQAYHVASMHLRIGRSANFSSHAVTLSGAIVRHEVVAGLAGVGGECTLNGLYLGRGRQLVDNHTTICHLQPHCNSHELYKGILDDEARAVFNGKIVVAIDAQKTDAKQTNKALLLSEQAQINTKPELEIFADDVRCTHGATIGQLDADALFYLRSRGLGPEQARNVLIHAFASDLLSRIRLASIREQLDAVLLQQLPGSGHTPFSVG